jgi:hypothetical protein
VTSHVSVRSSKFLRAVISSEINFAVGDKETALKSEKQKLPETTSYFSLQLFIPDVFVKPRWAGLAFNTLPAPTSVHIMELE